MDKKIAVMQPYFFPYYGYFQLIRATDVFVVFDDVNYINRGWINRNRILVDNQDGFITIPISKASQNKLISEHGLADDALSQQKKILEKIKHSYKKAQFFAEFYPFVERAVLQQEKNLVPYLVNSLQIICEYLEIPFCCKLSSEIEKDNSKKGQEKIIELCNKLEASQYINLLGGQELYKKNAFLHNNIDLKFISANPVKYKQFEGEFITNLSIIDLLMFNSKAQSRAFINNYTLI